MQKGVDCKLIRCFKSSPGCHCVFYPYRSSPLRKASENQNTPVKSWCESIIFKVKLYIGKFQCRSTFLNWLTYPKGEGLDRPGWRKSTESPIWKDIWGRLDHWSLYESDDKMYWYLFMYLLKDWGMKSLTTYFPKVFLSSN